MHCFVNFKIYYVGQLTENIELTKCISVISFLNKRLECYLNLDLFLYRIMLLYISILLSLFLSLYYNTLN